MSSAVAASTTYRSSASAFFAVAGIGLVRRFGLAPAPATFALIAAGTLVRASMTSRRCWC